MKTVKELLNSGKSEKFNIGDWVLSGEHIGEIINLHPKYTIIISEGHEYRVWTNTLKHINVEIPHKKDRMYKESYTYRGFKSINLTRELAEDFRDKAKETDDPYALLNCLKAVDYVLGITENNIGEMFPVTKIQLERAKRYTNKFGINISEKLSELDEKCFQYSLIEGITYTTTDRLMVSRVIASVADVDITGMNDASTIINKSIIKLRQMQLVQPGWKLLGRMLKVATKSGIRWNKDVFSPLQQKQMELV